MTYLAQNSNSEMDFKLDRPWINISNQSLGPLGIKVLKATVQSGETHIQFLIIVLGAFFLGLAPIIHTVIQFAQLVAFICNDVSNFLKLEINKH